MTEIKSKIVFSLLFMLLSIGFSTNLYGQKTATTLNTGSYYKGNFVWCGAMNLAWNELNDSVIKGKVMLNTDDQIALSMLSKFNNPRFNKKDLDDFSYYIKSGFGAKTAKLINKDLKAKFPGKSFKILNEKVSTTDIIAYAYFQKQIVYATKFSTPKFVDFNNERVEGFCSNGSSNQCENVKVIEYVSDEKLIVKIKRKADSDELILAMGFNMSNPEKLIDEIHKFKNSQLNTITPKDKFSVPKLNLNFQRKYEELMGIKVKNKGFENYKIVQMFEDIKFNLNEKGAKVENEGQAIIISKSLEIDNAVLQRNFIFNKPFWVVMQRKGAENPYFILGINNSKLMRKVK